MLLLLTLACHLAPVDDTAGRDSGTAHAVVEADLVVVVDNSRTMTDDWMKIAEGAEALATAWNEAHLSGSVALTTVNVEASSDAGTAGAFVGPALNPASTDFAEDFKLQLYCQVLPWLAGDVPPEEGHTCGDEYDVVTIEVLDCLCGEDNWGTSEPASTEQGLEAALLAGCRAVDSPTPECTDTSIGTDELGTNAGVLRSGVPWLVAVISDEGDSSSRLTTGEEDPSLYVDLLDAQGLDVRFSAMGPDHDPDAGSLDCNHGDAATWQVARYQRMAEATDGAWLPILEAHASGACVEGDFSVFWAKVAASARD